MSVTPNVDQQEGTSLCTGPIKPKIADKATERRYYEWLKSLPPPLCIAPAEWANLLNGKPDDMLVQFIMFEKFLAIDPNPTWVEE